MGQDASYVKALFSLIAIVALASTGSGFTLDEIKLGEIVQQLQLEVPFDTISDISLSLNATVVEGSLLDAVDYTILSSLKNQSLQANITTEYNISFEGVSTTYVSDETPLAEVLKADLIILVGGPAHNKIAGELDEQGIFKNKTRALSGILEIGTGQAEDGTTLMYIGHYIPPNRLEREAVRYSPLRGYIPEPYIPVAASAIGGILLALTGVLKTVLEFKALSFGRRDRKLHSKKIYEIASIVGASLVLGLSVTWTFIGPGKDFIPMLALNSGVALFAALSHEISHRILGKLMGVHIEYHFWTLGSAVTLFTGYLGNAFGVQGFLLEKADESISRWKYALVKLAAPILSIAIAIAFAWLNTKDPKVVYQMVYSTSSLWAMAEILPFEHLDGKDIRNWSRLVWIPVFILITAAYLAINFIA
ncbi:MAG: hypothetical protein V1921_00100 [Candidatus Altiarchaeota archaeon]